jgi:hypothetical protein
MRHLFLRTVAVSFVALALVSATPAVARPGAPPEVPNGPETNLGIYSGTAGGFVSSNLDLTTFYTNLSNDVQGSSNGLSQVIQTLENATNLVIGSGGSVNVIGQGANWTGSISIGDTSLTLFTGVTPVTWTPPHSLGGGPTPPGGGIPITQAPGPIAGSGMGGLAMLGVGALLLLRKRQARASF